MISEKQMKAVRKIMYRDDDDDKSKSSKKKINEIKITGSSRAVMIESGGVKHQLPTMASVSQLIEQCRTQKNALTDAQSNIKKLTETIKKMDSALKEVERELTTKADMYDSK